ncbi:MAG: DUF1059 domain-containing protein [Pseudonocardiaceae bacterium]|nr:DUF1059 domain-containing protein [Pseudonocardiaceae bacterium]
MNYTFRCVDAGAPTCFSSFAANTEEELRNTLIQHLGRHGVTKPNETLVDYLLAVGTGRQHSLPLNP